jgi:hypothetical protein
MLSFLVQDIPGYYKTVFDISLFDHSRNFISSSETTNARFLKFVRKFENAG